MRCKSVFTAVDRLYDFIIEILDDDLVAEGFRRRIFVPYFGFSGHLCRAVFDIDVRRINVNTGRLQVRIERQGLVELVRDVEPDVLIYAAVICVKIAVIPLKRRTGSLFLVVPGVIDPRGEHIFARNQKIRDVESKSHHAIFAAADEFAVEIKFTGMTYPFEFEKQFFAFAISW